MHLLFYILCWLTFGVICSRIAERRGRNPGIWFVLGIFLGLIGVITLYLLPKKSTLAIATASSSSKPETISPSLSETVAEKPLEKLWYYLDKDKIQYGPMSFYALQEAWDDGKIAASTYMWNEDMENWTRLEDLSELLEKIKRVPLVVSP